MRKIWRHIKGYVIDNFLAEQSQWIALFPLLFATGIALYFALPFEPNIWLSVGVFELCLLLIYLCRLRMAYIFFLAFLVIICGFINIQAHSLYKARHIENIQDKTVTYLKGQIAEISRSEKGKIRLLLADAANYDNSLKGNYRITLSTKDSNLQIGQCVEMVATLFARSPMPILGGYQTDRKNFYENLSAIGYADSEVFVIDCPPEATGYNFKQRLNKLRKQVTDFISGVLPQDEAGVADALLVGEKSFIGKNVAENYRNSGLAHFLSVSGLHLGSIAGLVFFLVRLIVAGIPWLSLHIDAKKTAAICAIAFSFMYLLISGMAIPAQRAFIMTTVVLIGVICNRQAISLRMVCFAATAVLIISPQALISISFQMSFAAVFALVAFYERYAGTLARISSSSNILLKIFWYLGGIIICDFVASLATTPFALYHFHRVALYTSLGNLLAGPLIGLWLMPAVLLCLFALPFGLAEYPLKLLGYGIEILNHITDFVTNLPHSVWQTSALSFSGFILIVCGGYWLCIWQRKWRKLGLIAIFAGILTMLGNHIVPDVVIAPQARNIAVRDKTGNLLMLAGRADNWLESVWQENLNLHTQNRKQKNKILQALRNEAPMPENLPLKCADGLCVYKEKLQFDNQGNMWLNGQKIDTTAGGYVYWQKGEYWLPLWQNNCRIWRGCE